MNNRELSQITFQEPEFGDNFTKNIDQSAAINHVNGMIDEQITSYLECVIAENEASQECLSYSKVENPHPKGSHFSSEECDAKGKFSRNRKLEKYKARNAGLSYMTLEGKVVRAREMKPLDLCREKCKFKLSEEVRKTIFNEYWALGSRDKRAAFVSSHVESKETKTKRKRTDDPEKEKFRMLTHSYHFKVDGIKVKVCKGCFMKILDETNMFVTLAIKDSMQNSSPGLISPDNRGKESPANKKTPEELDKVRRHILSLRARESQNAKRKNDYLSLSAMYSHYRESVFNPVCRSIYDREFRKIKNAF